MPEGSSRRAKILLSIVLALSSGCEVDASLAIDRAACPLSIGPLPDAPRIDGRLDPGVRVQPFRSAAWVGDEPMPSGIGAEYAVGHRPEGLYVYVAVRGTGVHPAPETSHPYCGDAIEIFVDADGAYADPPRYDVPGSMQVVIGIPPDDTSPLRARLYRGTVTIRDFDSPDVVARRTDDGFAVEVFLRAADLDLAEWRLAPEAEIGFNLAVGIGRAIEGSETGGCDSRLGQFFLQIDASNVECPYPYCSTSSFCPVALR